jgi:tetratricopeptide (TPR) repeat protein
MTVDQVHASATRVTPTDEPDRDLGTLVTKAWQAFHARDYVEAIRLWAVVREHFPQMLIGYAAAVTTFREAKQRDAAKAMSEEAVRRFPDEAEAHTQIAWMLGDEGRHAEAIAAWTAIRERFSNEWTVYLGGARTLRALGRDEEADAWLTAGIAQFPKQPVLLNEFANAAASRGDWAEAARRWAVIRSSDPGLLVGYTGGAQAARQVGRADEAEALLREAIDRFPADPGVLVDAARMFQHNRDWTNAIDRWQRVRERFPDQMAGYVEGAAALRAANRFNEADAVLAKAIEIFPSDPYPLIECARVASAKGDVEQAARSWDAVLIRFPKFIGGYTDAMCSLTDLKRPEDAARIAIEALLNFPDEFRIAEAVAQMAARRHDWEQAQRLFATLRTRFPNEVAAYLGSMLALRELRRFEEAEAVAKAGAERFPNDIRFSVDLAWIAHTVRDWKVAIDRWAKVRQLRPDFIEAYLQAARAMEMAWRRDEAEALLTEGLAKFAQASELATQYAWMAVRANQWDEAERRFADLRETFPSLADGWIGGAWALRDKFDFESASVLLEDGIARFPEEPRLLFDYARLPLVPVFAHQKDWPEAVNRFARLHAAFPSYEPGLIEGIKVLKDAGLPKQAEELARSACTRLPESYDLAILSAETAEARQDYAVARERYLLVQERFPHRAGGAVGLARHLAAEARFVEAEAMLCAAIERFPTDPAPFSEYADFATRQEKWADAQARWNDAATRFPNEARFAHKAYEARMRFADEDPVAALAGTQLVPAPMPDLDSADQNVRDLVMQFENLGGRELGCEFGIFQRDCGAEPMGLLRWADMPFHLLTETLCNRFEGVGSEEFTELFTTAIGGGRAEYCTRDRRGMMFMRTFFYEDEVPVERMKVLALNRIRYLKQALIDDLEQGDKIFVFRVTDRNLTLGELDEIRSAMQEYGHNTLLYVRYEDADHPNGTVEMVRPGLMIGYIDRFKISRTGQLSAAPPTGSWLEICRNAYALWHRT